MTDEINKDLFDHLVELAALALDATEGEYLRHQLNNQLKAIHELEAIPLDPGVPLASHGVPYSLANSPTLRTDVWHPYPNPAEILSQAPEIENGYIIVPEIQHTQLE